jgi:hypothetical protein
VNSTAEVAITAYAIKVFILFLLCNEIIATKKGDSCQPFLHR